MKRFLAVAALAAMFSSSSEAQVDAQVCAAEWRAVHSLNPQQSAAVGDVGTMKRVVGENIQVSDFQFYVRDSCGSRCSGFGPRTTWVPDHPMYREILLAYADYEDLVVRSEQDAFWKAARRLNACVARYLAKSRRAYQ